MAEPKSKKGFASMDKALMKEIQAKGKVTRRKNLELRKQLTSEADGLRKKADELQLEVERLRQDADDLDGDVTSDRQRKKREALLLLEIDDRFRDSVSSQYLKMIKQHAILRGLTIEEIVTPSMIAMDVLVDPNSSAREKQDATRSLQQFENSKPVAKVEESTDVVGSAQEEFDKLMMVAAASAPKR